MPIPDRRWLVLVLFFCSGATALVYEVVWSKFLSQMFGSTVYAQTIVLAAFMGGLAIGNRLFGRQSDRLRQPVRIYGYLEIAIGLYAFFFPTFDRWIGEWFVRIGAGIATHTLLLLLLKGVLSVAVLLGPTILMGGTLPLLAAWLQRSATDPGRRSARFYSVNSLGAVAGAGLAGFWLVQNLGMIAALQATALMNILVGGTAIVVGRNDDFEPASSAPPKAESTTAAATPLRWAGLMVALTGGISMGLEVLASRSLAMIFGSSLQSFAIVLMAFILGIGLGSAWIASRRLDPASSERTVAVLLSAAAAWILLLVFNIERWVEYYRMVRVHLPRTPAGWVQHELVTGGAAMLVLGIPAACIGAVLPLMIRVVSREGPLLGRQVGTLLTWNTLGAVTGTMLTGFVLMPAVGLRNAFGILSLLLAAAAVIAWRRRWRIGMAAAGAVGVAACLLFCFGGSDWRSTISAGAFRINEPKFDPTMMAVRKKTVKLLFYEDSPDATVTVEEFLSEGRTERGLRINGKPDASTIGDLSTQLLCAHLPMLARPGATDVFVLGLGCGVSAGAITTYPVRQLVVAENCEPVIRAQQFFTNVNRDVLHDPRTQLWHEDARTVLRLKPQLYDVIITEPSNPWSVGVGSVFSRECYEILASRLKPGGLVAQWFHLYETHDEIVMLVLRTFSSVFPFVEIWETSDGDIVLLGSNQPWRTGPDVFRQSFALEKVRSDLAQIGILSPEAVLCRQMASQSTAFAIPGPGPMQSDLFPVLEYVAPRAFYIRSRSHILELFDERTRQQWMAPEEKNVVLRAVSLEGARPVFRTYESLNEELMWALFTTNAPTFPCVFGTNTSRQMIVATETAPGAESLIAATKAFAAGNLTEATEHAAAVLKEYPADLTAGYLARVIERRQQLSQTKPQELSR